MTGSETIGGPTDSAALHRALDSLSPQRRALLAQRLGLTDVDGPPPVPVVERRPGIGRYPASPGQERLYYIHGLAPDSAVYLMPVVLRITGPVSADRLRSALVATVDRHESLRTGFALDGRQGLTQVVHPAGSVAPEWVTDEIYPDDVVDRVDWWRSRPFDLASPPLLRAAFWTVVGTAVPTAVLALCVHHLVVDGWSTKVLVDELVERYTAASEGRPAAVPDLRVQYVDFAAWQRRWLESPGPQQQLEFWRTTLASARGVRVPSDRPRRVDQSFAGSAVRLRVEPSVVAGLARSARAEQGTLYMALAAAFAVVLRRWSGQDDLVIGAPVAGRPRPELESVVGLFINMIPLRVRLDGASTFDEMLRRVRSVCLDVYAHQDVPFERVARDALGERRGGRSALVTVMLALHNVPVAQIRLPHVDIEPVDLPRGGADFDLTLALAPTADSGLTGWLVYSADLFDPDTAERFAESVREVLAAVAAGVTAVADFPVMSGAQRRRLVAWEQQRGESVLDGHGSRQPIGVPGYLHIDGRPAGRRARWCADGSVQLLDDGDDAETPAIAETTETAGTAADAAPVAARDDLEEVLTRIWVDCLDVPGVGVHDDFFELGGHSLLATLVVAQIRDVFRVEVPMYFFVDAPTVAALAELLRATGRRDGIDVDRIAGLALTV
ncbi:condensation domain-containing protein [Micromonospora sp. NPDC048999]|uniref:condensation domain-containing protein n=1 Tax=Micromonospora sp. NPDC048999 TaxID=3155391 RepID=UPI00340CD87C